MTRYALNLPVNLKKEAEELAARQGISLNQFIMWSVSEKVTSLRESLADPKISWDYIQERRVRLGYTCKRWHWGQGANNCS